MKFSFKDYQSNIGYRFAFNGQERDDEVSGAGNSYTAEYWQYDPRLGRRFNIDPVVKSHESSYTCFANNPIWFGDLNGADTAFTSDEARAYVLGQVKKNAEYASLFQKLVDDKKAVYKFNSIDETSGIGREEQGQVVPEGKNDKNQDVLIINFVLQGKHFFHSNYTLFEETYHADQYRTGLLGYENIDGKWGGFQLDIYDEAKAKIWAIKAMKSGFGPNDGYFSEENQYLRAFEKNGYKGVIKILTENNAYMEIYGKLPGSEKDVIDQLYFKEGGSFKLSDYFNSDGTSAKPNLMIRKP